MKLGQGKKFIKNKYTQLLAIIIVLFILAPALSGTIGQIMVSLVLTVTIIAIIRTLNLKKREFLLLLTLAVASFGLDIQNSLRVGIEQNKTFVIVAKVIYILFILMALVTINQKIFSEKKVSGDTIQGGIAVFFLIGIAWALLYVIVYLLDPNAFNQLIETVDLFDAMFYFSFTTVTTLGYGDISPISDIARTLANLEAVIGVMYPAIYISRIVALYTTQETSNGD
ncbi:MAG: ion channel [Xenococcus sp. MO_188.B8]|nr:ion channel [Xenococcus sp. MO_188.B8]